MSKRKFEDDDPLESAKRAAAKISLGYAREAGDPDFFKDIEINDLRNRYVLTKATTHARVKEETGANVYTRGMWYPDKAMATEKDPALYLHITADDEKTLERGIEAVKHLMAQELGPLNQPPPVREKRRWGEEKLIIGLENMRNFNIRAKVVGPAGLFVKHIQQETQCKVQVKGQGSGFVDQETGRESDEPMHLYISGPDENQLKRAKELGEDLLVVVRHEWQKTKTMNDQYAYQQQYAQAYGSAYGQQPPLPLPDSNAPPPPPGQAPPPPPSDPNAAPATFEVPAHLNQTPEQQVYWNQIKANPQYAAYYAQVFAQYQPGYQAQPGQPQMPTGYGSPTAQPPAFSPAMAQPPPPVGHAPPLPSSDRREAKVQYPPPPGL